MNYTIKATPDQLAKLADVLMFAFQEGGMGYEDTSTEWVIQIDDDPAIYEQPEGEALCWSVVMDAQGRSDLVK